MCHGGHESCAGDLDKEGSNDYVIGVGRLEVDVSLYGGQKLRGCESSAGGSDKIKVIEIM